MSYAERATAYAEAVVGGDVPACRFVKLAAGRHLDDIAAQKRKTALYRWEPDAADVVCGFMELMPHVKGRWAQKGELLRLEDWQCFVYGVPFGWKRKADGFRRFRKVYIEVPRKNAKSTGTAGLGLYMFAADDEFGAEVYSGATSEKQAWEVFGPARLMAKKTDDFRAAYGVQVNAKNLHILANNSKFEPVIGKPGDGASPSFSITDEYHEHATSEQYDTMVTGMGARDQPMAWVITTAGSDTSGPCYNLRSEVAAMLDGTIPNDQLFGVIYTIDEGEDWTTEEAIRKANPNADVSVRLDYLLSQQREAVNNPRKQSTFKMKHLNVWTGAASPYFNLELWNRLGDPSLSLEQFKGETCFVGVDLAQKIDLTAAVLLFRREIEGETHFYAFSRFYLPEARVEDPGAHHFAGWAKQGHVTVAGIDRTDHDYIEGDIIEAAEAHPVAEVACDPYNAGSVISHLQSALGTDKVVEVPQTVAHLSDPMKEVQALIADGKLHHDGNPCFAWQIGNVTAQEDRNQNVFPRKERRENKIDGAIALILAVSAALRTAEPVPSIYESRGPLVF